MSKLTLDHNEVTLSTLLSRVLRHPHLPTELYWAISGAVREHFRTYHADPREAEDDLFENLLAMEGAWQGPPVSTDDLKANIERAMGALEFLPEGSPIPFDVSTAGIVLERPND